MNTTRKIENENLKESSTYFLWLLLGIALIIGFQFLNPIIKPNRYSGSLIEWIVTIILIAILIAYFLFTKRFKSISFDTVSRKITLTTLTLIRGTKTNYFDYENITHRVAQSVRFRGGAKEFVHIFNNNNKLITLEKSVIGDSSFEDLCAELQRLKE